MPSALETLVKILKLEREQGCKNSAVIGGLGGDFSQKWSADAHQQARKPEHHLLVDELFGLLHQYEVADKKNDRLAKINYMLDRITGRVPPPPEFRAPPAPAVSETAPPPDAESSELPPRPESEENRRPRSPERPRREPRPERPPRGERSESQPERLPRGERSESQPERPPRGERSESQPERPPRGERSESQPERPPRSERSESQPERPPRGERSESQPERPPRSERSESQLEREPRGERSPQKPRPPQPPRPQKPSRSSQSDEDDDGDNGEFSERGGDGGGYGYDDYDSPRQRGKGGRNQPPVRDIPEPVHLARPPRRSRPALSAEEADDILRGLRESVTTIKGVGPAMGGTLEKLDLRRIEDLLTYFPRRHDDYTRMRTIKRLVPDDINPSTVIGTVVHAEVRAGQGGRKDFFMVLDDGTARMAVTFFGQHFLIRTIKKGQQLVLSGKVSLWRGQVQMNNPDWEPMDVENLHTVGIVPVYGLTEGLSMRVMRKIMRNTVTYWADRVPDFVPEATLERCELADLGWTLRQMHFPEGWDHLAHAKNRHLFDRLLILQLAMLANRRQWQSVPAQPLTVSDEFLDGFISAVFPYPLTSAQRRAVDDIRRDAANTLPMNRLLQGDVGSGKTAVAVVAIALALANGKQAALMVPTSILAEQHYRNVSATLKQMPGERPPVVALLTGALSTSERESIYRGMADGSIDVVIGTHALIQEGVTFNDLGVAVIDEQHRFGVEQRKALRGKATNPHLLVMTATPIPRSLALTIFADLDLSVMDEMPPGRIPIETRVIQPVERSRIYNFIEAQLNEGRQAFVVHPLVEASETIEAPAAVEAYDRLQKVFFRHKVGLLHGRMKPAEKDEVMAAFASGEIQVLVTTSVAEVGVNVPNATVMMIEGADRFGLSQLHQFRGRVGRGEHASYCLLLSDTNLEEAQQRLAIMESTNDGFKLAEMDWKLRGAGDLVGTRQSGGSTIDMMREITPHLVELAQREARTIYAEDPDLAQEQHRLLAQRVSQLHNERTDLS